MGHTATYSPDDNKIRLSGPRLSREDYERSKTAGFRWAPKQDCLYATWSPSAEDFALEFADEIEDDDKTLVDRAEDRAERFEGYSESRAEDAKRAHAAVSAIADNIPFGQPILVGHHSERHARRDAEKIQNGMRKAVQAFETSQYWKSRAAGALAAAKYKERPDVRARRIKDLESELRKCIAAYTPTTTKEHPEPFYSMQQKWTECYPRDRSKAVDLDTIPEKQHVLVGPHGRGGHMVAVEDLPAIKESMRRWEDHYMHRLEYETAMLEEAGGTVADRKGPEVGGGCKCWASPNGGYSYIRKVNKVSVTVEDNWGNGGRNFTRTMPFDKLKAIMTKAEVEEKRAAGLIVDSADKTGFFVLDAKPPERKPEPATDPAAAPFEAMKETLKAGVQVVSANQLFPTPSHVARQMVEEAEIEKGFHILEPSAGTGALLDAILAYPVDSTVKVRAIEINYDLSRMLASKYQDMNHERADFLELQPRDGEGYDRILMNPPFENGSDIKHILHALTFLKPGGRLVAICANGPRQNDKLKPLADSWEELPAGTFEGTGVRTVMLVINKPNAKEEAYEGGSESVRETAAKPKSKAGPTLAENAEEAQRMTYAGRSSVSLRESKIYDIQRANDGPLFRDQGRLF